MKRLHALEYQVIDAISNEKESKFSPGCLINFFDI